MVYAYYDKSTCGGIITTNLKAIEDISDMTYDQLRYFFRNGKESMETDQYVILRKNEIIKKKSAMQSSKRPKPKPRDLGRTEDFLLR